MLTIFRLCSEIHPEVEHVGAQYFKWLYLEFKPTNFTSFYDQYHRYGNYDINHVLECRNNFQLLFMLLTFQNRESVTLQQLCKPHFSILLRPAREQATYCWHTLKLRNAMFKRCSAGDSLTPKYRCSLGCCKINCGITMEGIHWFIIVIVFCKKNQYNYIVVDTNVLSEIKYV